MVRQIDPARIIGANRAIARRSVAAVGEGAQREPVGSKRRVARRK
jgi:hypothetical protein